MAEKLSAYISTQPDLILVLGHRQSMRSSSHAMIQLAAHWRVMTPRHWLWMS